MARMRRSENEVSLDADDFLNAEHALPRRSSLMTSSMREKVKRVALGKAPHRKIGERMRALTALAATGGAEECEILSQLLADEQDDAAVRAAAATGLSLMPVEVAEQQLIENLDVKEESVRGKIIKALGCIGGEDALHALDRISESKTRFLEKRLAFSKTLISYRLGLERDTIPFPEGAKRVPRERDPLRTISAKQVERQAIQSCLDRLVGCSYRIDFSEEFAFEIMCGQDAWTLLLDRMVVDVDAGQSLASRKMLAGLLARWSRLTKTFFGQYILLSNPRNVRGVELVITETNGQPAYSGLVRVEGRGLFFSISDVERHGAVSVSLSGSLGSQGIEIRDQVIGAKPRVLIGARSLTEKISSSES